MRTNPRIFVSALIIELIHSQTATRVIDIGISFKLSYYSLLLLIINIIPIETATALLLLRLFSCEDAAQQVIMSVCPSV